MREELIMPTKKELERLAAIRRVQKRELNQRVAAEFLALSTCQVRNLVRKVERDGSRGLAHENRGKPSPKLIFFSPPPHLQRGAGRSKTQAHRLMPPLLCRCMSCILPVAVVFAGLRSTVKMLVSLQTSDVSFSAPAPAPTASRKADFN